MKIIVTGGAGMIGTQLVKQLTGDIVVLDNFSRGQNKIDGVKYIKGDATNLETCLEVFQDADCVYNLAAEVAGVQFNQNHHPLMFENNILLATVPLKAAKLANVKRFLQVSSVCIYGEGYNNPCLEENGHKGEPTSANAGYSWAKRMGERLANWYDIDTVIVRPSNAYGPYDYFDERGHVIPNLIKQVLSDKLYVEVHGDGKTYREFIYSEDLADGMKFAMENGKSGQVYNLGTGKAINTREVLAIIEDITGIRKEHKPVNTHHTGDGVRWSDCSLINSLGWQATTDLREGLQKVIDWYVQQ